jgi:hypothetical protein
MGDALVTVATFPYQLAAAVTQALLESHGLTVFLADVETSISLHGGVGAGVKLQVPPHQVDSALQILAEIEDSSGGADASEDDEADDVNCPACGLALAEADTRCSACGWSYSDHEEWTEYENGPVPDSLLPLARSSGLSRRFGLPLGAARLHLQWCRAEGLAVRGWEVWRHAQPLPVVVSRQDNGGLDDAEAALEMLGSLSSEVLLFSVNVQRVEDDA